MGSIIVNKIQGGLGRALPGKTHYSGIIFYSNTLPSGFSSNDRIKKVLSLTEAEALGIVNTFADETKATGGAVTITGAGTVGETVKIALDGATLASHTTITGDTVNTIAAALGASVNAGTYKHGWTATVNTATVSLIPPTGLGAIPAAIVISFVATGTATATLVQFSGGAASKIAAMHYQVEHFFQQNPKGVLYIGIYAVGTYSGAEVKTLQDYAGGELRQIGVVLNDTFASSQVTATKAYTDILDSTYKPLVVILTADFTGISLSNLADLSSLSASKVNVNIGMDGAWLKPTWGSGVSYNSGDTVNFEGKFYSAKRSASGADQSPLDSTYWAELGYNLTTVTGKTVTAIGAELGALSNAKVSENIGWVQKFLLTFGNYFLFAGVATGELFDNLSTAQQTALDVKHYTFVKRYVGLDGVYFSDTWTSIARTSDFATLENNRTIDEAIRKVRTAMLPLINSPLYVVGSTGKISESTIAVFKNAGERGLEELLVSQDISDRSVDIDPDQNVLTTSQLVVGIRIVPVGVAREIVVNIGFVKSL